MYYMSILHSLKYTSDFQSGTKVVLRSQGHNNVDGKKVVVVDDSVTLDFESMICTILSVPLNLIKLVLNM
jgi:hypothetical protein